MTDATADTSRRKQALAWAMYDWGNSAFATTVMAGFFPIFFKKYWSAGADVVHSTFHLGVANSVASVLVAVLAPMLGAFADESRIKKLLLAGFAALGCIGTAALYGVGKGDWQSATALYVAATLGFSGSLVFYDALLVSVATPEESDRVSLLGYGLGYLGGGLLFAVNVLMTLKPAIFGLADASASVRWSFVMVGAWWAVFTWPLLRSVREPHAAGLQPGAARRAVVQVVQTLRRVRAMPVVWTFLVGYWLYIDAVDTVMRMAVDYGMAIGLKSDSLMIALLITQFVGFPAAIGYTKLAAVIGAKRGILLGIGVYVCVTVLASMMSTALHFYALAVVIGLVQGGVQALSRSFYSRLIPTDEAGEFFGFYNMLGKFAAVIGPVLMGLVGLLTGSPRLSILSITVLFVAGGAVLMRVNEQPASS
ncbi:MAG TPA: MFS transporter [Polyangiales bacterium]